MAKPKSLSAIKDRSNLGVRMDVITVIEYLQALLTLVLFIGILAVGFKVWRWNYVVPPRSR
jgi:hypothetical protein